MVEYRTGEAIGTVLSPIQVSGMGTIGSIQFLPNLADVATIGTVLSPLFVAYSGTLATIQSPVALANLADVGTLGTILSPVTIVNPAFLGTIGTIQAGNVSASIIGGNIPDVGTIGTILNLPNMADLGTLGTIVSPVAAVGTVQTGNLFLQTIILTNAVVATIQASTLVCATLQDLVVDMSFGTVFVGSIQGAIVAVDPQLAIRTATLFQTPWDSGTIRQSFRLVAEGPLGAFIAVQVQPASGGTLVGTILGVYVTAEQSTTN